MHKLLSTLLLCFSFSLIQGQQRIVDSLKRELNTTGNDTLHLILYKRLSEAFEKVNVDSTLFYAQQYLRASKGLGFKLSEADAFLQVASSNLLVGNSATALAFLHRAEEILQTLQKTSKQLPAYYLTMLYLHPKVHSPSAYQLYLTCKLHTITSTAYFFNGYESKGFQIIQHALYIANSIQTPDLLRTVNFQIGVTHAYNKPDSALYYLNKSYHYAKQMVHMPNIGIIYDYTAKAYHVKGNHLDELHYKRLALESGLQEQDLVFTGWSYIGMADYYGEMHARDSALYYAHKALQVAQTTKNHSIEYWSSRILKDNYKSLDKADSAFVYMERMLEAREKTSGEQNIRQFEAVGFSQQLQQQAFEAHRLLYQNKIRTYGFIAGIGILISIALILWRNNRQKQKANLLLAQQKDRTEQALQELKATQGRLIQKEKMASLGELTAGIAHEIQNPLNFVNNFSETNTELLEELTEELDKGNIQEAKAIAVDAKENQHKILLHGKRAEAIVKGMLEHSRTSKGERQPTDINALTDEYLRLAYHGFRAKDKSFNAKIETYFDESVGEFNIVPQDIGRVLLNLFNNALYAVSERKKLGSELYEPTVTVTSKKVNDKVEIVVKDNGGGIPKNVINKVFQPFFTTKPTGQGTGLGLSLSYDIVKAHGGELRVESKEGESSTFTFSLSIHA